MVRFAFQMTADVVLVEKISDDLCLVSILADAFGCLDGPNDVGLYLLIVL
jgi:hypothetical protein